MKLSKDILAALEEVKKDKRYKASVRKNLSPDAGIRGAYDNPVNEAANYLDDVERVTLYEYYDVASNTMSVCAENSDEFLADPIAMPYAYGQPFVMLRNYDIPDYFYPMGDLESIESLQLELDKTRSQLMNDRKRYGRKYLYHERSFGPEMFFSYTREDIAGEYDFTVEGGSTMPMNDTIRKQQAVSLLNAISPLVGTVIDPSALAMHVLREGFDIKNPERFMMQQPAPDQVVAEEEAGVPTMPMDVGVPEEPVFAPTGGVPPELLSQLQNQMGVELPFL